MYSINTCMLFFIADSDAKPFQRKKKKPLAERIAEKEAAKLAKEVCTFLKRIVIRSCHS